MLHPIFENAINFQPEKLAEILDKYIGGFRQYVLNEPAYPAFISQNLCDMLGYTKEELFSEKADVYASVVHPADKQIYLDLLSRLSAEGTPQSAEYRILRKDGAVLYVRDSMTAERLADGSLVGYSILTDITEIKAESENLRLLNETIPCGILRYTCEKNPKITYINEQMLKIMKFPKVKDGEIDYFELYRDNIYLMLPMEERRRFSRCLARLNANGDGAAISGELSVLRCDGTKARLYGWVTKKVGADGKEEYQSVCLDVTERYLTRRMTEKEQYLKALSDVYDKIFEYDFINKTVKYIYGNQSDTFGRIRNIPMQMEEATTQWIEQNVCKEDRARVKRYFGRIFEQKASDNNYQNQIEYHIKTKNGVIQKYLSTFFKMDAGMGLFCCRRIPDEQEADSLRSENLSLRSLNENMREMVRHFTDGIAAFEVTGDHVTPLYASDNLCEFFGFPRDEWLSRMKRGNSIREFVSRSGVDYEKFIEFLEKGEAEFSYRDIGTGEQRLVKAICSPKSPDDSAPRYVMLYHMDADGGHDSRKYGQKKIHIRTFGYFDVFVDDKPIAFRNKKAKELLALLVDRRGGYVSSEEAIGFLWEEESANAVTLSRYRKEALRLKNTLEEYGISDMIESVDGKRRIVPEKVQCDLYDYLAHKEGSEELFCGSYLTNYSWAEKTLGELLNKNT